MGNHLKGQASPYLLQHAHHPVNWYPWCSEAFEKAIHEDKPVFLSIGYSTCHWCHVMAHESFEDEQVAGILNKYFVSIKVDREERPDIDSVYMSVCQAFTGSGGWPMSIFMTPQQKPFFAGTYFPIDSQGGMIGLRDLLLAIAGKWEQDRMGLIETAESVAEALQKEGGRESPGLSGGRHLWESNGEGRDGSGIGSGLPGKAAALFRESFDKQNGGFGAPPKFPLPHNLVFLMLYGHLSKDGQASRMAEVTLDNMRRGGLFDQIGYGFSRYSTDKYFLVPHFEKMLYDNALLIIAYAAGYKSCGREAFINTAQQAAEYILREMAGSSGEFYAAQDADSDGEEGRYYTWQPDEIYALLGSEKAKRFCRQFGITREGNFEGRSIPNLFGTDTGAEEDFEEEKRVLYEYRKKRAKLHLDDKVLASWNALMVYAMAVLYRVTGNQEYLQAAQKAQRFIENNLVDGDIIYVSCCRGKRSVKGFLDDYAYVGAAYIGLYDVTGDDAYLKRAEAVCKEARRQFESEKGGYYLYGEQNSQLIARPKECYDGALPSGNSVMAYCLVRLSHLTGDSSYAKAARKQLAFLSCQASQYAAGYCMFLIALLYDSKPPQKITAVLPKGESVHKVWPKLPLYADICIRNEEAGGYKLLNGKITYYACRDYICLPPANELPDA